MIYSKRVELAIREVVAAQQKGEYTEFSIFSQCVEYNILKELVRRTIFICKLDAEYIKYSIYLTATVTETFGLILMEAVGLELSIVGFDFRYGNAIFISDEGNG